MAIKEYKTDNIHINSNIVDSDGSYGTSGQVLSRDAGGVTWADGSGSGIIGGPYLPLSAGSSYPLTGDLYQTLGTIGVAQADGDYIAKIYELNSDGFLSLYTGQPTPLERIRISSYGNSWFNAVGANVGIGTTSPGAKLDVAGNVSLANYTGTAENKTILAQNSYGTIAAGIRSGIPYFGSISPLNLDIYTGNNSKIRIENSTGNVGIGVTDPEKKLEVKSDTTYDGIMIDVLSNPEITFRDRGNSDTLVGTGRHALDGFHIDTYSGNAFFIKGNNRYVGIGETDPKAPLNIKGVSLNPVVPTAASSSGILRIESGNGGVSLDIGSQGSAPYSMWMQVGNTSNNTGDVYPILLNPLGGNVGIGTTSPTFKLHVNSTDTSDNVAYIHHNNAAQSSGDVLKVRSDAGDNAGSALLNVANNTGTALYVRGDRNVGIGTTSPSNILHVSDAGTSTLVRVGNNAAYDAGIYFNTSTDWTIGTDTSNSNAFTIGNSSSVGASPKVTIATGGNVGIGTSNPDTSRLLVRGSTNDGASLIFQAANLAGASRYVVRPDGDNKWYKSDNSLSMVLTSTGNLGIGTTSPSTKLHVDGTVLINASGNNSNSLKVYRGALQTLNLWNATNGAILSLSNDAVTDAITLDSRANQKSYINTGGNFGIGTTNPLNKLFVSASTAGDYAGFIENTNSTNGYGLLARTAHTGASAYAFAARAGASDIFVVRGDGNVGIGTTSPGYKLTVNGDVDVNNGAILAAQAYGMNLGAAGYDILMPTTTRIAIRTGASERISILNTGNVGIGTTTPNVGRLEVGGASPTLAINSSTNTDPTLFLLRNGGANGIGLLKVRDGGHLSFDTGATGAAQSEKMRITSAGGISFGSTGTAYGTSGQVLTSAGNASPTWTTPSSGGGIGGSIAATQLAFGSATADEITGSAEATFLESVGKTLLQVGSTSGKAQSIININQTNDNTSRARLELSKNTSTRGFLGIENASTDVTLYSDANLVLDSDGDDVIITTQGTSNVGVGNTTPGHKLDVTGRIKASKGLQVGEETSTTANAASEGTIRYRGAISVGSKTVSVVEMCMQVSATPTYAWEAIYTTAGWV